MDANHHHQPMSHSPAPYTNLVSIWSWKYYRKAKITSILNWKRETISEIDTCQTMLQIVVWHRAGDKPLSEPLMVKLLMHIEGILPKGPYPPCLRMADRPFWQDTLDICVTQPQLNMHVNHQPTCHQPPTQIWCRYGHENITGKQRLHQF